MSNAQKWDIVEKAATLITILHREDRAAGGTVISEFLSTERGRDTLKCAAVVEVLGASR